MANQVAMMHPLLEPPTSSVHPYHPHHCRDLALQKYLFLHEQHESLRQHLDELRPTARQQSICAPISPSPSTSPSRGTISPRSLRPQQQQHDARSPQPSFSLPARKASCSLDGHHQHQHPEEHDSEVAVEEARLCDVAEGMKRALTELLNCETVRSDRTFRTWVQCRLMDTERELRSGRRRRSAPGL
ncbi:uncharacterized protein C8A04DRAFT_32505 [Dichotomopilus funicola]|uniref:Uncharacterized protein n=1 Tax=Dichotomopilus funicola TaxID=1934379 RepID=A0AAN6UVK0_9PEZI|nr:hypothetical protein C8A04DRAFT_32505 [Dichotomopilus funicola]